MHSPVSFYNDQPVVYCSKKWLKNIQMVRDMKNQFGLWWRKLVLLKENVAIDNSRKDKLWQVMDLQVRNSLLGHFICGGKCATLLFDPEQCNVKPILPYCLAE